MNPLDLSIIIVSWNTRVLTADCLDSIYSTAEHAEVIVVDNASTDGTREMIAERFPQVVLIANEKNDGFAAANNLGLARARGRYVMLLNPDTVLCPGALERMVAFMEMPGVGLVGPMLVNSDGSLQGNGQIFPSLAREVLHITKLYRLFPRLFARRFDWGRENFDTPCEVDWVTGACMLTSRKAIERVGPLDTRFFMYYEDTDWCCRMKQAGYHVWYLSEAYVVHHGGKSSEKIGRAKMGIAYESQYKYFAKHHGRASALILRALSRVVLAAMRVKR